MASEEITGVGGRNSPGLPFGWIHCPIHGRQPAQEFVCGNLTDGGLQRAPPICFTCYAEAMIETTRAYTASMLGAMRDPTKPENVDPIEEARRRFDEIKGLLNDPEAAHGCEDNLHVFVLQAIRDGGVDSLEDAQTLASVALQTLDLEFARWCA